MKKKPLIIAHRGASAYEKDNTLQAFLLAKKMGTDVVEMDVRQTKDEVLVLHHDRGVKRGRKRFWIDKIDFIKLRAITKGEIVKLENVIKKLHAILYLDLKQEGMEKEIVRLLKKYKIKKVFVCSTDIWVLKKFEDLFSRATLVLSYQPRNRRDLINYRLIKGLAFFIYFLLKPFLFRLIKRRTAKGIEVASLNRRLVSPKVIDFFHAQKIKVFVWDVDREKQMKRLIKMEADGIITKKPDILKRMLYD